MKKFKLKLKNPARELEGKFYTVESSRWSFGPNFAWDSQEKT